MRYRALRLLFLVWAVLWAFFILRELFLKDNISGYRALLASTLEGKRSYVTGEELYRFLMFCSDKVPSGASYFIEGLDEGSIESRRSVYYLYPRLKSEEPDFILVYGKPGASRDGYRFFAGLDGSNYILRKIR
jgi:hypothetical protein